jgi:hypothetical protein
LKLILQEDAFVLSEPIAHRAGRTNHPTAANGRCIFFEIVKGDVINLVTSISKTIVLNSLTTNTHAITQWEVQSQG